MTPMVPPTRRWTSQMQRLQSWIGPGHPPVLGMAGTYYRNGHHLFRDAVGCCHLTVV